MLEEDKSSHSWMDMQPHYKCRSGLMYMTSDQDSNQYPHVLLTSPHEWDPSVLDPILIPMDICPGHLILLLGTNMTQE